MSNASNIKMPFLQHAMNNGVPQLYIINNKGDILKEYSGNRTAGDMFEFSKELMNNKKSFKKSFKKSCKKLCKKSCKKSSKKSCKKLCKKLCKKKRHFKNNTSKKIVRTLTPWNII